MITMICLATEQGVSVVQGSGERWKERLIYERKESSAFSSIRSTAT
jgi:hypothetical protein